MIVEQNVPAVIGVPCATRLLFTGLALRMLSSKDGLTEVDLISPELLHACNMTSLAEYLRTIASQESFSWSDAHAQFQRSDKAVSQLFRHVIIEQDNLLGHIQVRQSVDLLARPASCSTFLLLRELSHPLEARSRPFPCWGWCVFLVVHGGDRAPVFTSTFHKTW